jgi:hypothetical protein
MSSVSAWLVLPAVLTAGAAVAVIGNGGVSDQHKH